MCLSGGTEVEYFKKMSEIKNYDPDRSSPHWASGQAESGGGETKSKGMGDATRRKSKGSRWPIRAREAF